VHPTVLVVAASYGLLLRVAIEAGLLGIPLRVMVSLSLWRYSYEVLRQVARGSRHLPPPGIESMNPVGEFSLVLHFAFWFLLNVLVVTTPYLGDGLAAPLRWIALAIVLLPFPASAAIMGITRSLPAAVNPGDIATVIRVLGRGYLQLLALCVGLAIFTAVAQSVFGGSWLVILADVVSVWALLAFFAATGAAVGERRADFDLPGEIETRLERDERHRQDDWQKTLDRAYTSIRGGLAPQGYRTIKDLLASEGDSLDIYQWTFNKMVAWEDKSHAMLLAEKFIAKLIAAGRSYEALDLVAQCRRFGPAFALTPTLAEQLIAYARKVGRHRLADELAAGMPAS
jgi:hypothetical protein